MLDTPPESPPAPPYSRLAIAAFVVAVVPCCPLTGLLGFFLGLAALRRIAAAPGLRGRQLATAAVFLGIVSTVVSAYGIVRFARSAAERQDRALAEAVQSFVVAAQESRFDDARKAWVPKLAPDDAQVRQFVDALGTLGDFQSVTITRTTPDPFTFIFESSISYKGTDGFALGACRAILANGNALAPVFRLQRLRLDRSGSETVTLGADAEPDAEPDTSDDAPDPDARPPDPENPP